MGVKESKEKKKGGLLLLEVEDNWDLIGGEVSGAKNRYSKKLERGQEHDRPFTSLVDKGKVVTLTLKPICRNCFVHNSLASFQQ